MTQRTLGPFTVSPIGLGAMPLSMNNDREYPTHEDAVATVHAALDAGVTFIDTADCYAPAWDETGHNESIVGEAVRTWSGEGRVIIGTKAGITRSEGEQWGRNASAGYVREAVERSLTNLGVDQIDLFQYHRPDRTMVYADTIASFAALREEGLVHAIGISNANIEEIQIAQDVLGPDGLASVQNEFSPKHPGSFEELRYCGEHGIAFLPWSPLGGTGGGAREVGDRFEVFAEIAKTHGVSPQRVVLAWELSLGEHVVPIPGARRAASIQDSAQAHSLDLSQDELTRCSRALGLGD